MALRPGRKSAAQTPAPRSERIYGSKKNPKGSAASEKKAAGIKLSDDIMAALKAKLLSFKKKYPGKDNITLNDLKAVYRRGAGAYSSTHRPTISGGKPNTRNAWAMARVNKFLEKAAGKEVKKAYVQDNDLLKMTKGGTALFAPNDIEEQNDTNKIALPDTYSTYESLKKVLSNQGYELTKAEYKNGGEVNYEDAYVKGDLMVDSDTVNILDWNSKKVEHGGTEKSLRSIRDKYKGRKIFAIDSGYYGEDSYMYWDYMLEKGLIDGFRDDEGLIHVNKYEDGGKITSVVSKMDKTDFIPIFYDNDTVENIDFATVKNIINNLKIPIKITEEIGKGFHGVAFKTSRGTVLKVTNNGNEALNSYLIMKNADKLKSQAKVYNVFIVTDGWSKLYFIEKETVNVATKILGQFTIDYFMSLWEIGMNEKEEDYDNYINQLVRVWEYDYKEKVSNQELKYAKDIVYLAKRATEDGINFNLEIEDINETNVGFINGKLFCFDCAMGGERKLKDGGEITDKEIKKRWDKKRDSLHQMSENIQSLRHNITKDIKSDDEKTSLTALVISIMDKTGERVGNEESASNGHFGITGLLKKHLKISGNTVTLNYTGKSGVEHEKQFSDYLIAEKLRKAINKSPNSKVFTTSDGFHINEDKVNRYLADFDVTAKDLRGYSANKWVIDKLKKIPKSEIPDDEIGRKRLFNKILSSVAEKVGHGRATLKKHYLLPSVERTFVDKGKMPDLSKMGNYRDGGSIDLLAPNGKPSNLTPEQYRLVRTPEFKAWFGFWENDPENASKVVDENGEPLVVYHGTPNKKFTFFDTKKIGFNTNNAKRGFYFSDNYNVAHTYTIDSNTERFTGEVFEVFLNSRNISIIDAENRDWSTLDMDLRIDNKVKKEFEQGHDGVLIKNITDPYLYINEGDDYDGNSYVVDSPEQIKLADGSNTTFDGSNPDIRYENGGENNKMENLLKYAYPNVKEIFYRNGLDISENYAFTDGSMRSYLPYFSSKREDDIIQEVYVTYYGDAMDVLGEIKIEVEDGEVEVEVKFPDWDINEETKFAKGGKTDDELNTGIGVVNNMETGELDTEGIDAGGFDFEHGGNIQKSEKQKFIDDYVQRQISIDFEPNQTVPYKWKMLQIKNAENLWRQKSIEGKPYLDYLITYEIKAGAIHRSKSRGRNSTEAVNELKRREGRNFKKLISAKQLSKKLADGGQLDDDQKETYQKWKKLVNMTYSELEKFYNSEEGKVAGLTPAQAKDAGIDSGRESARWIMKMKKTSVKEWTPAMWKWAKKQISFVSRMTGNKGKLYDENGKKTRKHLSLLIWGNNPEKKNAGDLLTSHENRKVMNDFEYSKLPQISSLDNGKKIVIKESVFAGNSENPEHIGTRYCVAEIMGKGGIANTIKLKVHESTGAKPYYPNTLITRPIYNLMRRGRQFGQDLVEAITPKMKEGGISDFYDGDTFELEGKEYTAKGVSKCKKYLVCHDKEGNMMELDLEKAFENGIKKA